MLLYYVKVVLSDDEILAQSALHFGRPRFGREYPLDAIAGMNRDMSQDEFIMRGWMKKYDWIVSCRNQNVDRIAAKTGVSLQTLCTVMMSVISDIGRRDQVYLNHRGGVRKQIWEHLSDWVHKGAVPKPDAVGRTIYRATSMSMSENSMWTFFRTATIASVAFESRSVLNEILAKSEGWKLPRYEMEYAPLSDISLIGKFTEGNGILVMESFVEDSMLNEKRTVPFAKWDYCKIARIEDNQDLGLMNSRSSKVTWISYKNIPKLADTNDKWSCSGAESIVKTMTRVNNVHCDDEKMSEVPPLRGPYTTYFA